MPKVKATKQRVIRDRDYYIDLLCSAIATSSKGMMTICNQFKQFDENFPAAPTLLSWMNDNPEFAERYTRARQSQADVLADEIVEIADESTGDIGFREDGSPCIMPDNVQRSKLRVEARKWVAAKLKPIKYGDKVQNELTGKDGAPLFPSEIKIKLVS